MQPPLYRSHSPASHMSSAAEAGWLSRPQQGRKKGGPGRGPLDDSSSASLEVAAAFPPAQRLFVLFLEAADSHRLNTHLATCAPCSPFYPRWIRDFHVPLACNLPVSSLQFFVALLSFCLSTSTHFLSRFCHFLVIFLSFSCDIGVILLSSSCRVLMDTGNFCLSLPCQIHVIVSFFCLS